MLAGDECDAVLLFLRRAPIQMWDLITTPPRTCLEAHAGPSHNPALSRKGDRYACIHTTLTQGDTRPIAPPLLRHLWFYLFWCRGLPFSSTTRKAITHQYSDQLRALGPVFRFSSNFEYACFPVFTGMKGHCSTSWTPKTFQMFNFTGRFSE